MVSLPPQHGRDERQVSGAGAAAEGWTLLAGGLEREDVRLLLAFHFEEMRSMSPPEACHVLPVDALRDPAVTLWALRERQSLLGLGALKALGEGHGEVKSMRTAPGARGRGAGTAMLLHIMAEARSRGYRRLSLETGSTAAFQPALRLYARHGFEPCGPFGEYHPSPFTVFLTREL
jgi:putative acetyltransferase